MMSTSNPLRTLLLSLVLVTTVSIVSAQTATYHLHKDASSTTGLFQLLTDGPNATITFSVWLKKSSTSGVMYPRVKLFLNSSGGTLLGSVTGATALTPTLTQYTFNVNTTSQITMSATDRFYLWIGVNVTTAPTRNTDAVLNVEGTLNGNHDSYVTIPLPNTPPTVSLTSPF